MSQRKLLLADDSITIQKVVNLTFADEGIEVLTVGDGDAAMEKMSDFKPDLILADVNMPGLNGYQICEKVKQSEEFNKVPVILLVGSFEPFDESEAQRVGADDFLTKPFQSIRQLVSKVTELLDSGGNKTSFPEDETNENQTTAEFPVSFSDSDASSTKFADDGIDDEMVQTLPGGFGLDETAKFETRESFEPREDFAKTQPLSPEDFEQISANANEGSKENLGESNEEYQNEHISSESDFQQDYTEAQFTQSADLDFDDNFLELPPIAEEETEVLTAVEEETQQAETNLDQTGKAQSESAETNNFSENQEFSENYEAKNFVSTEMPEPLHETFEQTETNEIVEQTEPNTASFVASSELSSETIDIIVQKVVEKLSDKVVREIAWEVVPQMTDLIVKKMAEEKMKES